MIFALPEPLITGTMTFIIITTIGVMGGYGFRISGSLSKENASYVKKGNIMRRKKEEKRKYINE